MNEQKSARMHELVRKLNDASHAYYVLDNPYISDMQWDQMYDELRALENETGIVLEDSPSRHVGGGETLRGFEEHRHISRLWSLDKERGRALGLAGTLQTPVRSVGRSARAVLRDRVQV